MAPMTALVALLALAGVLPAAGQTRPVAPAGAPAGDWPAAGRDPGLTRFSPLTELTPANVNELKVLWSWPTGSLAGHEGNPLVIDGKLYLQTPHPSRVVAFDLNQPGAAPLWSYSPPAGRGPVLALCCDVGNRGLAWHPSGKLYLAMFTGDLVALDARTGKQLWRVTNGDPATGTTMQSAPLVVGGLVIVGVGGGEFGNRGYLTGYDAHTGKQAWRAWSMGSDQETLIGPLPNLNYPSHQGPRLGLSTWNADSWQRGGGATWGWLSYDPDLDLVYYGTGAPAPMNGYQRIGDNKWTSSLIARNPKTGLARWVLQLTPGDRWGFGASNENILLDLNFGGRAVKGLVHFDRNGFAYTIDRATGRLLLAQKYGPVNWAREIHTASSLPVLDSAYLPRASGTTRGICPSLMGMKAFQPAAYSPITELFFVPAMDLCMDLEPTGASFQPGQPFVGAKVRIVTGSSGSRGRFLAWSATTGSLAWEIREPFPVFGGALATAGGLVFYGTLDGWLKAVDATNGRERWRFKTPSGIVSNPISFAGPNGRQLIAVVSGIGGWPGRALKPGPDRRPTDGIEAVSVLADLMGQVVPGGVLLILGR